MNKVSVSTLFNSDIPDLKYYHFYDMLEREVLNLFEWEGLDKFIPSHILEKHLVKHGKVIFFNDDQQGYLALKTDVKDNDLNGRPLTAVVNQTAGNLSIQTARSIFYEDIERTENQGVLIRNNLKGESLHQVISFYAERLAMIWTSMDINLLWQNLPPIYSAVDNDVKLSVNKLLDDIWSGKPLVVVDRALNLGEDSIRVGLADVPFLFPDLFKAYQQVKSEFREYIGINTVGTVKESGVKGEEITANSQAIRVGLDDMLSSRRQACKELKLLFGIDVTVNPIKGGDELGSSNDRIAQDTQSEQF